MKPAKRNGRTTIRTFFLLSLITASILLLSLPSYCQEIKSNTVDGFTNERTIETTIVPLKEGFSTGFGISYIAINNNYYLNIIGYGNSQKIINEDDKLWFVLDDGSVVKFERRLDMPAYDDEYPNMYIHHYFLNLDDVEDMKTRKLVKIRIVSGDNANDIPIAKKGGKQFAKLNEIFLGEVSKQ